MINSLSAIHFRKIHSCKALNFQYGILFAASNLSIVTNGQKLIPAFFSTSATKNHTSSTKSNDASSGDQVLTTLSDDGIFVVQMNRPRTLNAWTEPMLREIERSFEKASQASEVKVLILTGGDCQYYCAGVNLSSILKPMHPRKLHGLLRKKNQRLFDMFLEFNKPIIAAVNGPAIGASVTSAALCDAIVASETATFSTPFARLGLPPEGCSSVHFAQIMGKENAERMIGKEGWIVPAREAHEIGLVRSVVPQAELMNASFELARDWIKIGKPRQIGPLKGDAEVLEKLKKVNANETIDLADSFFSEKFLEGQRLFLSSRGKTFPASMFMILKLTRPFWKLLLPPEGEGKLP
jgi:peroxisomal 3,2-trans-enoyl-CoA isomerase